MSDPKNFFIGLFFTVLMIICIIINCRTISRGVHTGDTGIIIWGAFGIFICIVALVFNIIQMINSY